MDEWWIVTFSVVVWKVFHRAFNTMAAPLSSTSHVALSRPVTLNVVTPYSEEPLEDLLIPHISSTNRIHSNFALCFAEGVLASTDWNRRIRVRAHSVGLSIPFGQNGRTHVLTPGLIGPRNPPTKFAYGSEAAVVVDDSTLWDLAGHGTDLRFRPCLPRRPDSNTKSESLTMPTLTPTERG